jgi:NADH-quinone oxidoreductase subunit L
MFRAVAMTFWGSSRLEPEVERHVHESGVKMTVPLLLLAFFSVVAGYVSWPKPLGGSEGFDRYLDPVFSSSEALLRSVAGAPPAHESAGMALMLAPLAAAGIGIFLACWLYLAPSRLPDRVAQRFSGFYHALAHKYYVDEIYDWLVVRPVRAGSEKFLWRSMDAGAIDGVMVGGTARAAADAGGALRRMQSGNIRSYAAWVLLGAVLWLGYLLLGH